MTQIKYEDYVKQIWALKMERGYCLRLIHVS